MLDYSVEPSQLQGSVFVPPSKSHTLRSILFAAAAIGKSKIEKFLQSPDTTAMIEAVRLLGADVKVSGDVLLIEGVGGCFKAASDVIQCGNSGLTLRLIGALAGLIPDRTILTGDHSLRHNRPAKPLLDALLQLGVQATSNNGHAPLCIQGPFTNNIACLDGQDSQPVSGLLIAAAFAPFPIEIHVTSPGEKPWVDLTLDWLDRLNIAYQRKGHTWYRIQGSSRIQGFTYTPPGDFSTAAFLLTAALITQSELTLLNMDPSEIQGDKAIIPLLEQMGARFTWDHSQKKLTVHKSPSLQGTRIDVNDFIDALPILAVIGCFATGTTELVNGAIARAKESDRIASMTFELRKMGAQIEERPDGLLIYPSQLYGADLQAHSDHRVALSLTVAALAAKGGSRISGAECIEKTYPHFAKDLQALGGAVEVGASPQTPPKD